MYVFALESWLKKHKDLIKNEDFENKKKYGLVLLLSVKILSAPLLICFVLMKAIIIKTRTKTSIRYAKENDRDKTERRRERERKVEGEI